MCCDEQRESIDNNVKLTRRSHRTTNQDKWHFLCFARALNIGCVLYSCCIAIVLAYLIQIVLYTIVIVANEQKKGNFVRDDRDVDACHNRLCRSPLQQERKKIIKINSHITHHCCFPMIWSVNALSVCTVYTYVRAIKGQSDVWPRTTTCDKPYSKLA